MRITYDSPLFPCTTSPRRKIRRIFPLLRNFFEKRLDFPLFRFKSAWFPSYPQGLSTLSTGRYFPSTGYPQTPPGEASCIFSSYSVHSCIIYQVIPTEFSIIPGILRINFPVTPWTTLENGYEIGLQTVDNSVDVVDKAVNMHPAWLE